MLRQAACLLSGLLMATLGSCGSDQPRHPAAPPSHPAPARSQGSDSRPPTPPDTALAPDLTNRLQLIRTNYQRINAIRHWSSTATSSLDEPGEGGEVVFYYANGHLEKVVAQYFGEMGKQVVAYYLPGGQPSFVLEKLYSYNRPIYYDSAASRQAHDTEAFAPDSSAVEEHRSYFAQGQLLHQLPHPDAGSATARYRQQEQERIMTEFRAVLSSR